ncbi:uncharacterized protein si:dkey-237j10.2 [Thalassophryne amazonica]|uniref:uncharacterized protein si:dkey-237j10.2 n=1 Tax=Thalassophryne amazonica TaxID=390379 RepID=UPI0014719478|nr:uncharacterized protein si:dkey-237j10.2 [Thalassophryne amazonica]
MLAEGFLRMLRYREERKLASPAKVHKIQKINCDPSGSSTDLHILSAASDPNKVQDLPKTKDMVPQGVVGLLIPRGSPGQDPDLPVDLDNCSLLQQYPDLKVAESGWISYSPLTATDGQHNVSAQDLVLPERASQQTSEVLPNSSMPDQGYLVMGGRENISLDLPGSELEPMSNSMLNGFLEKQLEEVYMQHLTDNLARCNSQGNSLLHGLVPPPQTSCQCKGPDSLEAGLYGAHREEMNNKSYFGTQNLGTCSSNFSTPVLRISEEDNAYL